MSAAASSVAWVLLAVVTLHAAWWLVLALLALPSQRPRRSGADAHALRLVTLVPAHNEERLIGRTVASLTAADPRVPIVVVADNCTDATADLASRAGAVVLERTDLGRRGKSFALDAGLAHIRASAGGVPDAVVFVDADTTVSGSLYEAIRASFARGADAVQVHYAAAPGEAPLARLRSLAFALIHWSRPLGASRIGVPMSLKGNGMALRWHLVADGYGAGGLAEDAALTVALARQGTGVTFAPGATVWGEMGSTYAVASTQDARWEAGRLPLAGQALAGAAHALRAGQPGLALAMLDLALLPLTAVAALGGVVALAGLAGLVPWWAVAAPLTLLAAYVAVGLAAARTPWRDLAAFAEAPRFVRHKLGVYGRLALRRGPGAWHRTAR